VRRFDPEMRDSISDALSRLIEAQIYIDVTDQISATEFRAKSRELHQMLGRIDLLIIDDVQLVLPSGHDLGRRLEYNRAERVSIIVPIFRALARELDCPTI
jgi:replicative DNA helicase